MPNALYYLMSIIKVLFFDSRSVSEFFFTFYGRAFLDFFLKVELTAGYLYMNTVGEK